MASASKPFPSLPPPTRDGDTVPGPFADLGSRPFDWPLPSGYAFAKAESRPRPCDVFGPRGSRFQGFLIDLDVVGGHATVQSALGSTPVRLSIAQIRRLTLTTPVPAQSAEREPLVDYRLDTHGDSSAEGRSAAPIRAPFGIFLFPPVDDAGSAVLRTLVPSQAFERLIVGAPQRWNAEPHAAATGANAMLELLRAPPISAAGPLLDALARQPKLPPVRLGETLRALEMVSEADLERVLGWQRERPGTPIGELLVRAGAITPKQLHRAMLRRLGYPVVHIGTFPVELEAVVRVPLKTATRLRVLPLLLRDQRLVVAMEDPSRDDVVRELEFASQCTVMPVLAHAGAVGYAMTQAVYERLGVDVWLGSVPLQAGDAAAAPSKSN